MSNLARSAKSGSDWSAHELLAYHITVKSISRTEFFRSDAEPSLDHLDPRILTTPVGVEDANIPYAISHYLGYLDLATQATQESLIDDFARETLFLLGFAERTLTLTTRFNIPLTICGDKNRNAQTDVCLIQRPALVLLILAEDKTLSNQTDAESQVIAEAIAAFQFNNAKREQRGLLRLQSMTIPCITMSGTRPTFYLVPVTEALSTAVITAQYPAAETTVLKCVTVPTHQRRVSEGMESLEYRKLALQRFLAFKELAKSHWQKFLIGYD